MTRASEGLRKQGGILIVSLQYSPIYKSHCKALGDACEERRHRVKYLLNCNYGWMLEPEMRSKTYLVGRASGVWSALAEGLGLGIRKRLRHLLSADEPSLIYFSNFHPFLNRYLAKHAQRRGSVCAQHVHEPFVQDKRIYGGFRRYWLPIFEMLQESALHHVDAAVLSSNQALRLFDMRYPGFGGRKLLIPLMYEDLGSSTPTDSAARQYVTFVGPPSRAKGVAKFAELLRRCDETGVEYRFLLVSNRRVKPRDFDGLGNLTILQRPYISDEEIGRVMKTSLMTLTPYTVAAQSAVIPVSYMYGTPVVSSNVGGLPEEVVDRQTGVLLEPDAPVEQWLEAMDYVRSRLPAMRLACRQLFESRFAARNWERHLDALWGS